MTPPVPHILVVDDEPDLRDTVCDYLRLYGMRATAAEGGDAMRRVLADDPADLVVLDVKMPGESGLVLARWLREHHTVGIVIATTMGDLVDRIVGLEIGADDYVAKPLDLRELVARIKAVLRRRTSPTAPAADPGLVPFGRFHLDVAARVLRDEHGAAVTMTRMELDLLVAFAGNPDRVLSRALLLDLAHGKEADPFDRSIDMRIARIRQKVEPDPTRPSVIVTVRGAGYMFSPPCEPLPS